MERRGRAVVLGRSDRDRPAFLVFRTCFQLFELVASVHFPMTVCAPHFLAFRDSIDWASGRLALGLARRSEKSLSFWVRAMSLPVHNGARRGGAGTLWVRMASLRAIAPATFASSRRSGDASAPKTRCVATVARRGAASGRAESALLTRKVRHSPRGPAPAGHLVGGRLSETLVSAGLRPAAAAPVLRQLRGQLLEASRPGAAAALFFGSSLRAAAAAAAVPGPGPAAAADVRAAASWLAAESVVFLVYTFSLLVST